MENKSHKKIKFDKLAIWLIVVVALLVIFNQWQVNAISKSLGGVSIMSKLRLGSSSGKYISNVSLDELKSTGHSVAALFPVEDIQTTEDAIAIMVPTGTPDYGSALEVSFDDPLNSLSILSAQVYPYMLNDIKKEQAAYQRYLNIVLKPVGISCEYCCGVGAIGARNDGSSACGCQHNPALLGLTMWLVKNSDYSDAEIVREALKWKSLFFPKDMVNLALTVAGGDTSKLGELPGMVGGC